jgi:hypothetical protein
MNIPKINKNNDRIMNIYNYILHDIINPILGNTTTYSSDLDKIGRKLLNNFIGVCSSDTMPHDNNNNFCFICNLDASNQSGSHWIAIYIKDNNMYCYDSFGRNINNILHQYVINYSKKYNYKIINSDLNDREQEIKEYNCGQRSLSFLVICHHFSIKDALTI